MRGDMLGSSSIFIVKTIFIDKNEIVKNSETHGNKMPKHPNLSARMGWKTGRSQLVRSKHVTSMLQPETQVLGLDLDQEAPVTASETALRLLKHDLERGVLAPGRKLKMRELTDRYGIGASPMREALALLVSGGFVKLESNKGFRVAPVSRSHLIDVTQTRQIVEGEALKAAITHGTKAWEEEIFTSFQLLKREIELRDSHSQDWLDQYEQRHHRFHRALIAACPLASLKQFCEDLYTQLTRYRRMLKEMGFSEQVGSREHEEIMSLVLARDVERAVAMLRSHIGITAAAILEDKRF